MGGNILDHQPAVVDTAAAAKATALVHDDVPNNTCYTWALGDKAAVDAAIAKAAHVTKLDFINNRLVPNAIEPRAVNAMYSRGDDSYTLYVASQNPHVERLLMTAFVLGLRYFQQLPVDATQPRDHLLMAASLLMIWRLEAMTASGVEGTVLGTLVMPYCSGMGNLIFVFILARKGGPGAEVMTNALVNNVTNMTLVIGIPAILWGLRVVPNQQGKNRKRSAHREHQINRLSLLLTLTAVLFFTGAVWALGRDGSDRVARASVRPPERGRGPCARADRGRRSVRGAYRRPHDRRTGADGIQAPRRSSPRR